MTIVELGALGEFFGAILLFGSLIYVGIQIRQNTRSLQINMEQSISYSVADPMQSAANSRFPDIYVRASSDPSQLDDVELARYSFFLVGYFKKLEHAHFQFTEGNLCEESWNALVSILVIQFQSIGMQRYWSVRHSYHSNAFQSFIDATISQLPDAVPSETMLQVMRGEPKS